MRSILLEKRLSAVRCILLMDYSDGFRRRRERQSKRGRREGGDLPVREGTGKRMRHEEKKPRLYYDVLNIPSVRINCIRFLRILSIAKLKMKDELVIRLHRRGRVKR